MPKSKNPHDPLPRWAQLVPQLAARIKGQAEILARLGEAIKRCELDVVPPRGCRDCFFLAGPTGVGKTETALALGDLVFGPGHFVRFDCSEIKTLENVTALLGDRQKDRGRFGQAYAQVSEGIWLFDEIEKAHPEFVQLFLQMTDAGRITLANGQTLDLSQIYLFVTSNLGSAAILGRDNLPFTSLERHVVRSIQKHLRPELLGRFGAPYVFRPLQREVTIEIATLHFGNFLAWQTEKHGRVITADAEVVRFLLQRGFSAKLGARPLLFAIRIYVGNAIVENLMAGGNGSGRLVVVKDRLQLIS